MIKKKEKEIKEGRDEKEEQARRYLYLNNKQNKYPIIEYFHVIYYL